MVAATRVHTMGFGLVWFGLVFGFVLRRWCGLLLLSLASAFCLWSASVAPVRGGTYFLCRRKESKQRKRANT
ncbi:hypothetical protein, partial [Burkholderia sp. Ac-20365]|uniref:hypothetical protein n=1 Tax=Burkholderia sp. Ac-20365 TaxID=2703897 RepID=UPI00197C5197